MIEMTSKNILYVSHVIISTVASSHISSGILAEASFVGELFKFKKHSNEDRIIQSLARAIFDCSMADKKQFVNFFSNGKII